MDNEPLMRIVVESSLFFGLSDDDVVRPDAAVSQLEAIASSLQQLSETEQQAFLSYVQRFSESEGTWTGRTVRVEFLRSLGESLGLC